MIAAAERTITTATTPQTTAITVIELSGELSGSFTVRILAGAAIKSKVMIINHNCHLAHIPDVPAEVEVCTVTSYWAPGCRFEMITVLFVHGTVMTPLSCLFLDEEMMISYVTI